MAQFPCERCGKRYRGPGNRAYIAITDGADRWDWKPRLCPDDAQLTEKLFDEVDAWFDTTETTLPQDPRCLACAGSVDGRLCQHVYITMYTGRSDRRDAYARLHHECHDRAIDLLQNTPASRTAMAHELPRRQASGDQASA